MAPQVIFIQFPAIIHFFQIPQDTLCNWVGVLLLLTCHKRSGKAGTKGHCVAQVQTRDVVKMFISKLLADMTKTEMSQILSLSDLAT